jgi:hypothetical protein
MKTASRQRKLDAGLFVVFRSFLRLRAILLVNSSGG